jgi:hypothetical protein
MYYNFKRFSGFSPSSEEGRYINEVYKLAKSIRVVMPENDEHTNAWLLMTKGYAEKSTLRKDHRYYMNLAGQYHSTNQQMSVVSSDTGLLENLSLEMLAKSPNTVESIQYGERVYRELLETYPENEALLHGMINPVDITNIESVTTPFIGAWDKVLVEPNETRLIHDLGKWLISRMHSSANKSYEETDIWYKTVVDTILYMNIPSFILNWRLGVTATHEAHSYHIKMFLASHGGLAEFYHYLMPKQRMWLYGYLNMAYHLQGTQKNTSELITQIIEGSGFSVKNVRVKQTHLLGGLYERTLKQNHQSLTDKSQMMVSNVDELVDIANYGFLSKSTQFGDDVKLIESMSGGTLSTKFYSSIYRDTDELLRIAEQYTAIAVVVRSLAEGYNGSILRVNTPNGVILMSAKDALVLLLRMDWLVKGTIVNHRSRYIGLLPFTPSASEIEALCKRYPDADLWLDGLKEILTPEPTGSVHLRADVNARVEWAKRRKRELMSWVRMHDSPNNRALAASIAGSMTINVFIPNEIMGLVADETYLGNITSTLESSSDVSKRFIEELRYRLTGYFSDPFSDLSERHDAVCELVGRLHSYSVRILHETNTTPLYTAPTRTPLAGVRPKLSEYHNCGKLPGADIHLTKSVHKYTHQQRNFKAVLLT